jgi:hypothetical protein
MTKTWQFFAVDANTQTGFTWQWRNEDACAQTTSLVFNFYFDCVSDARLNGYAGPLPQGPKVALEQMPKAGDGSRSAAPAVRVTSPGRGITLTAMSPLDVRKRRTRAHGTVG